MRLPAADKDAANWVTVETVITLLENNLSISIQKL